MKPKLCPRCGEGKLLRGRSLCGICEIVTSGQMLTDLPNPVPRHFNHGLGTWVEDKADLKRQRQNAVARGQVTNGGWE